MLAPFRISKHNTKDLKDVAKLIKKTTKNVNDFGQEGIKIGININYIFKLDIANGSSKLNDNRRAVDQPVYRVEQGVSLPTNTGGI